MSLRLVPASSQSSDKAHVISHADVANPLTGTRDILRHGLKTTNGEAGNNHALQARLEQWSSTQFQTKMIMQRNIYGLGLPLRQMMERRLVAETEDNHFPTLTTSERLTHLGGGMNLHAEVLAGTDEGLEVGDVLGGGTLPREIIDIHAPMEKRKGMAK